MSASRSRIATLAFHAAAAAAFAGISAWLVREADLLGERQRLLTLGAAAASGAVVLLSVWGGWQLLAAKSAQPLRVRAAPSSYLQVLIASGGLWAGALNLWSATDRHALAAFCAALAVLIAAHGLNVLPGLWLTEDGVVDHLGRRTRFTQLEWYQLQPLPTGPRRTLTSAGRADQLRLRVRLDARDAEALAQRFSRAGLKSRPRA